MKCQRYRHIKWIVPKGLIVVSYVHKQGFLVGQVIVIFQLIVYQLLLLVVRFQVLCQLGFLALGPNEVCAFNLSGLVVLIIFIIKVTALPDEPLCLLAVPLWSALDDLLDCGVVVAASHIKLEVIAQLVRLGTVILLI